MDWPVRKIRPARFFVMNAIDLVVDNTVEKADLPIDREYDFLVV